MIQNFNSNLAASGIITAPSGIIDDLTTVSGAFSETLTVSGLPVSLGGSGGGTALTIKEVDGSPSVANVDTIVVSNDTLTDDGGGQVTISTGGTGGSGSSGDFSGATVTTTGHAMNSNFIVTWTGALYDTDSYFAPDVPTRLTVLDPTITHVVLRAQMHYIPSPAPAAGSSATTILNLNGSAMIPDVRDKTIWEGTNTNSIVDELISYPVPVTSGDFFEINTSTNDPGTLSDVRTWFSIEDATPRGGTSAGGGSGELTFSGTPRFLDPVRIRDARVPPITITTISGVNYDDEFVGDLGDPIDTGRWTIFDPGGNLTNDPPLISVADAVTLVVAGDAAQAQESVGIIQTNAPDLDTNYSVFTKLDLNVFDGSNLDIYTGIIFVEDSTAPLTTNFIMGGVRVQMESDTPTWEIGWYEFTDYTDTVPTRFSRYHDLNDASIQSLYLRVNRHFQAGLDRFDIAYSLDGISGWNVVDTRTFANFALNTYDAIGLGSLEIDGFLDGPHYSFFRLGLSASSSAPTPSDFVVWERDLTSSGVNVSGTVTGSTGSALTVEEQDGIPSVSDVTTIKVTNSTLTDEGGGVVSIDTGGSGGGGGSLTTSGSWFNVHAKPITMHPRSDFFDDNSGQVILEDGVTASGTHELDWGKWRLWDVDTVSGTSLGSTNDARNGIRSDGILSTDTNHMRIQHDASTNNGWVGVYQDVPASGVDSVNGDYTITARISQLNTFNTNSDFRIGIFVADDLDGAPSTSDLVYVGLHHINAIATTGNYSQYQSALWTDYNSISTAAATTAGPFPGNSVWVRINLNASNLRLETSISEDGIHFREFQRINPISFTPSHMGFGVQLGVAGAETGSFEMFAVSDDNLRGNAAGYGRMVPVITSASGTVGGGGGGGLEVAVESLTASGSALTGDVTLEGLGSVSLHPSGQTIVISGGGVTTGGGSGTITDINTTATGPSITITGTGAVNTITDGNTITVNADNAFTPTAVSGCYTHEQTSMSSSWSITHNLDSPVVNYIVLDSIGGQVQPDLFTIDNDNAVTIDFISSRTGTAHIFRCIDEALVNTSTSATSSGIVEFQGALITSSSGIVVPDSTNLALPFDTVEYDTGSFFTGSFPTRLTVPAGVDKVRLTAAADWGNDPTNNRSIIIMSNEEAVFTVPGLPGQKGLASTHFSSLQNVITAVVDVVEDDYFFIHAFQNSGGDEDIDGTGATFFSIEVMAPVTVTGIATGGSGGTGGSSTIDEGQVVFLSQVFG